MKNPYIENLLELSTKQEYLMINGEIVTPILIWDKKYKPSNNDLFFKGRNKKWEINYYNIYDIICEIEDPCVYILRGGNKIFIIDDETGERKIIK